MKVAIVTGASRGIGREIAKELCSQGIKVIANYNKSEEQAKLLKRYTNKVVVCFDGDSAGQKATLRSLSIFGNG